jgi:hypothetical protein
VRIGEVIRRLTRSRARWNVTALALIAEQSHDPFRVLVACLPRPRRAANRHYMAKFSKTVGCGRALRRPRRPSHDCKPVVVDMAFTS